MSRAATTAEDIAETRPIATRIGVIVGIQTILLAIALVATGLTPASLTESPDDTLAFVLSGVGVFYGAVSLGVSVVAGRKDERADFFAKQVGFGGAIVLLIHAMSSLRLADQPGVLIAIVSALVAIGIALPMAIVTVRWLRHVPPGSSDETIRREPAGAPSAPS